MVKYRQKVKYETFIDDVFMTEQFDSSEESEFDNICKDLRCYKYFDSYKLIEITNDEYEMCIDKFDDQKDNKPAYIDETTKMLDWDQLSLDQMVSYLKDKHIFSSTGESKWDEYQLQDRICMSGGCGDDIAQIVSIQQTVDIDYSLDFL